jgi:hypothetical protein
MIPELGNKNGVVLDRIDDAVFIGDAAGPVSGEAVFEGFRFANSLIGHALNVANQGVDPGGDLFVGFLPIEIVVPGMGGKDQLQSASYRSVPLPVASSVMDSRSRRAFSGLLRR